MLRFFCLVMLLLPTSSHAGIEELQRYYTAAGGMSNYTKGGVYKDQLAGHLSGGSLVFRGPRPKTLQPMTVTTPKFEFDPCTGSGDFRFGALSFVSSRELTQFMKQMARSVPAYAFKMAIKSACPMCEDIMSQMDDIARQVNEFSLNQCAMSKNLVDGAVNKLGSTKVQTCMMNAGVTGAEQDSSGASAKCHSDPEDINSKVSEADKDKAGTKSLLGEEYNLVWKALSESRDAKDVEFKYLVMSITGTIISKKIDGKIAFKRHPSLFTRSEILQKFIGAVDAGASETYELYSCTDAAQCLNMSKAPKTIEKDSTFLGKVTKIVKSMAEKLAADDPGVKDFTEEEKMLVNHAQTPLISMMQTEIDKTGSPDGYISSNDAFLEAMAYESVVGFIKSMIDEADKAVGNLELAQIDGSVFKEFKQDLVAVRKIIDQENLKANKRMLVLLEVKRRIGFEEEEADKNSMGSY